MNGNSRIPNTGKTVKYEAFSAIRSYVAVSHGRRINLQRAIDETVSEYITTARPNTIGEMVAKYLLEMSDSSYKQFCAEIKKALTY